MSDQDVDTLSPEILANAIRALSMDAVEKANSGHPGMPMGMADVATVLFSKFLRFDPQKPEWPDRDRFVLSAGHGSMLLYSLLHLTGYDRPTLDDLKNFRQLHSPTAGHPEYGELPGIETTTGPLGQGLATAVGMALAERMEAARYPGLCDHHTYVIAGDGCLMEGVSHEAASLAGHLRLSRLIVLYDDNGISIDGPTSLSFSDDSRARFEAYGWHVSGVDGHDAEAVEAAIAEALADDRPSLIACRTTIGFGSPNKSGKASSHGSPLGADEIALSRAQLGWEHPAFDIPADIRAEWLRIGSRSKALAEAWYQRFDALPADQRAEMERRLCGALPAGFDKAVEDYIDSLIKKPVKVATRKASEMMLEVINEAVPDLIGGSADLSGSNNTKTKGLAIINGDDFAGRYIHYGVREFGMAAAMNGIALHGGFIPYGGTFLVFTDYCRPAIRLSSLMKLRVIYVMTHDSIGLGEDGPTHQPVEHLASLRAMPNLHVFRPADVVETAECWDAALKSGETPSVLSLTRQGLPQLRLEKSDENLSARGGYILREAKGGTPRAILIATGSEVSLAIEAQERLEAKNIPTRVVSMPCTSLFDAQPEAYRAAVLGDELPDVIRLAVEAASTYGWERYVGRDGVIIGMTGFGASAPASDLFTYFGITTEAVVEAITSRL
ncbi:MULTISPECIES: transketolase [unclassified Iodidimonas]|uniref:transketolase n=1 Tax=unclassified Iodidimonas TaxID=2626145 RepID=UPI0024828A4B|nr:MULTISPECIES: transketolase [unclassified Iodidimonas]